MHRRLLAMAAAVQAGAYHIGAPGAKWGPAELSKWRAERVKSRSYDDVVVNVFSEEQVRPNPTLPDPDH